MLELLDKSDKEYDTDILLIYDENADPTELMRSVSALVKSGGRIIAQKTKPEAIRYRQLLAYRNGGLEILEIGN
jgi:hypothetical protein